MRNVVIGMTENRNEYLLSAILRVENCFTHAENHIEHRNNLKIANAIRIECGLDNIGVPGLW